MAQPGAAPGAALAHVESPWASAGGDTAQGTPEQIALAFIAALRDGDVLEASKRFDDVMWAGLRDQGLAFLWPQILDDGGDAARP